MKFITDLFHQGLSGMQLDQLYVYFFQLFLAGGLVFLLSAVYKKFHAEKLGVLSLAIAITAVTPLLKFSTPLAILAAAVIILWKGQEEMSRAQIKYTVIALLAAIGVGSGYSIFTVLGFVPVLVILFLEERGKVEQQ